MNWMAQPAASSIRVSSRVRRKVVQLARRLRASSQQEVVERALDTLEHRLFWEGFDDEAQAYLEKYPKETKERRRFGRLSADGLRR